MYMTILKVVCENFSRITVKISFLWDPKHEVQGFFSSEFGSVIRTQSQCQIVSFFPKRGPKIPNLLQTAKVEALSTKI